MDIAITSLRTLTIDGREINHRDLLLACQHVDQHVSSEYRRIVNDHILPAVKRAEHHAYDRHVSTPGPVSGGLVAGGHGSVSRGVDAATQAEWQRWGSLVDAYKRAAVGRGVITVPASRISPVSAMPWEIDGE